MLLEMQGISKSFSAVPVLHGVDFRLEAGEIHALVGHNGAGKSTLMKVLAGNYADYGGRIRISGAERALHTPRQALDQGVAIIYQDFALVPDLSVADNIALGREPKGRLPGLLPHQRLRDRSADEAATLGIKLPMGTPVRQLGVAAQQLTEIVRACSKDVRILVMDEPTARLAPTERDHLFAVMRRMADRQRVGIVYISHFLEEVREVADTVTVLRDGRVVETGPAKRYSVDDLAHLLVGGSASLAASTDRPNDRAPSGAAAPMLALVDVAAAGRPALSLSVAAGEIVGFAGLTGSGRTRLARAIIGDVAATGTVRLHGRDLRRRTPRRAARAGLVMVPEDRKTQGLALAASVAANIEATALASTLSRFGMVRLARGRRVVDDLIRRFQIKPPDPRKIVGTLSGGNAQKVLLARAVAASPKAMILDQPTAGVDISAKAELHRLITLSATTGAAVLLISDDLDELLDLCDRIVVMAGGAASAVLPREALDRAGLLAAISRTTAAAS